MSRPGGAGSGVAARAESSEQLQAGYRAAARPPSPLLELLAQPAITDGNCAGKQQNAVKIPSTATNNTATREYTASQPGAVDSNYAFMHITVMRTTRSQIVTIVLLLFILKEPCFVPIEIFQNWHTFICLKYPIVERLGNHYILSMTRNSLCDFRWPFHGLPCPSLNKGQINDEKFFGKASYY